MFGLSRTVKNAYGATGRTMTKATQEAFADLADNVLGEAYSEAVRARRDSKLVALNESGTQRIGEYHARAKLSDAQVDQMREDYEAGQEGRGPVVGYRTLSKRYGVSKRTVRDIVHYRKRNQWAGRWKRVT